MNLNEFQKLAARTSASLSSKNEDFSHMMLGIISEIPELERGIQLNDSVNIGEEIADIYWYIANFYTFKTKDFEKIYNPEFKMYGLECLDECPDYQLVLWLYRHTAFAADLIKKNIAYNKEYDEQEFDDYINIILTILEVLKVRYNVTEDILTNNINKLKVRYPDKFDADKAINRVLDKERVELEK